MNYNLVIDSQCDNNPNIKQRYDSLKSGGTYILISNNMAKLFRGNEYTVLRKCYKKDERFILNKPESKVRKYLPDINLCAIVFTKGTKPTLNKDDDDLIYYKESSQDKFIEKLIKRHSNKKDKILLLGVDKDINEDKLLIDEVKLPDNKIPINKQEQNNDKVKAISLFSGMGGDSLGIVNAGVQLLAYSEWEKDMRETHVLNFPESELIGCGDITKTTDKDFMVYKGKVDIIFAGFPCQGFSNAGNKDPNDPRNSLFRDFVRSTKLIKPKYIIGENVKGLLKRKTGNGEDYINIIESEFNKIGYNIYYKVYMCSKLDIGVPQNRERLIIVGIRKNLKQEFSFPEENKQKIGNLKNIIKFTMEGTLKIEPEYLDFNFDDIPEECIVKDMENEQEEQGAHPNLVQYALKRDYIRKGVHRPHRLHFGRRLDVGGEIIDIRRPINTIICSYGHCPRFFVPQKNKNGNYLRCLTPDELKQCQGFPLDYQISGNKSKKIKQIGNAVPPPLIEMIVRKLINM